ncbi:MAG: hypothetical protein ACOX3U_02935 [Christensenellales bacterium]|jgi:hypothetical protein
MYLRRSFNIFVTKFNLIFKMLFYIAIVIILMAAIAVSIFLPSYHSLLRELEGTEIIPNIKTAAKLLIKGDFEKYAEGYDALEQSYQEAKTLIEANLNKLYKLYILLIVVGIVAKVLITLSYIPFVDVVNKFMHSDINEKVTHNFVVNGKKSLIYSFYDLIIVVPLDALIFFIIFGAIKLLMPVLGIFIMPFSVAFGIFVYMVRVNVLAGWLPAIVYDNMSVASALIHSLKSAKARFLRTFPTYLIIGLMCFSFYIMFGFSTLGLGYFLGIPMILLFYRVLELVTYYNLNGHRYYVDHEIVVEPEKNGSAN